MKANPTSVPRRKANHASSLLAQEAAIMKHPKNQNVTAKTISPALWTGFALGSPFQRNSSTLLPAFNPSGHRIALCLASISLRICSNFGSFSMAHVPFSSLFPNLRPPITARMYKHEGPRLSIWGLRQLGIHGNGRRLRNYQNHGISTGVCQILRSSTWRRARGLNPSG